MPGPVDPRLTVKYEMGGGAAYGACGGTTGLIPEQPRGSSLLGSRSVTLASFPALKPVGRKTLRVV